jgi:ribosomal protein L7/L12
MFVPLWIFGLALTLLALFAALAAVTSRRRGGVEMVERQRRASPAASFDQLAVLASPAVRAALDGGRKIEAIKLIRERTGLGLRDAKDLAERHTR